MPVKSKFYLYDNAINCLIPRCVHNDKNILYALALCSSIANLRSFCHTTTVTSREDATAGQSHPDDRTCCGGCGGSDGVVDKTRRTCNLTIRFISILKFYLKKKVTMERDVLPSSKFEERFVSRMTESLIII